MNNNNIYMTNGWIGTLHQDYFKTASNALSNQIIITSNTLENHLLSTSNILENHSSNFTLITSNTLENHSSNFTKNTSNYIVNRYDPLIRVENESVLIPVGYIKKHTYISNSNIDGEIRFWCASTSNYPPIIPLDVPDYRTKIDIDGKLKVYYTYNPLISLTFGNGWIDIANSIVNLNASDANFIATVSGLEAQINNNYNLLEQQIQALILALENYTLMTESQRIQVQNATIAIQDSDTVTLSIFR